MQVKRRFPAATDYSGNAALLPFINRFQFWEKNAIDERNAF